MPVAADQIAPHIQIEVIQGYLRACEDVPEEGFAQLVGRHEVLVVWRDGALHKFLLEDTSGVGLAQSQFIADEVEVPNEIVAGLNHQVVFVENLDVENHIVFHFLGFYYASLVQTCLFGFEVKYSDLADRIANNKEIIGAYSGGSRVDSSIGTSGAIIHEYLLFFLCDSVFQVAVPQSDVAIVTASKYK